MGAVMGLLDKMEPLFRLLPEVKRPEKKVPFGKKMMWTAIILMLFFIMGNITLIGISPTANQELQQLQVILASHLGTLITAGIGPIVLASIILQLLVGTKIIPLDLTNPKDKDKFSSLQKFLAILMCVFEAIVYVSSGLIAPNQGMAFFVIAQITIGSLILLFLDEVVSKYGIGSGISLFIAAGVAEEIIWVTFAPPQGALNPGGIIPSFILSITTGINPLVLLPIIATILIFLVVVFAEGIHINIPIAIGAKGFGGRFPVKFLYVSNIPVILAVALFANIRLWALMTKSIPGIGWFMNGLAYLTTTPFGLLGKIIDQTGASGLTGIMLMAPAILQAIIYLVILIAMCVVFGKFWVEMAGQSAEDVSRQLNQSGMYIPGFRKDPRIIEGILKRYIPPITILGSIFVGLLSGTADIIGAIGSGTGILLTVGIVYRFYEEIAKEQLAMQNPLLQKFFK